MLKKTFVLIFAFGILFAATGSALAGHTPGHQRPPSCDKPNNGPNAKHCYPPGGGHVPAACNTPNPPPQCTASFTTEAPSQGGPAVTVGMLLMAGALGGGVLLVRRRWTGWLRRS